jgi:hypothetical protein
LAQAWTLKTWHFSKYSSVAEFVEQSLDMVLGGLMSQRGRASFATPERDGV